MLILPFASHNARCGHHLIGTSMKKLLATALLLTAGLSTSAHAGFISGTQVTDGGKSVNLQGLEWMPLTYTAGLSRNQVEAAGGFTDRFGGVWNAGEWRYATRTETETLLGSLWGGRYANWSGDNFDGASTFLSLFGALRLDAEQSQIYQRTSRFYFGSEHDCTHIGTHTCYGYISAFYNNTYSYTPYNVVTKSNEFEGVFPNGGYFDELGGVNMGLGDDNYEARMDYRSYEIGSLLVRSASAPSHEVSAPNVIGLFSLGLGVLLSHRRRKTAA